jgi:hypothetical protein
MRETESYLNQNFCGFLNSPKGTHTFRTKLLIRISGRDFFLGGKVVTP